MNTVLNTDNILQDNMVLRNIMNDRRNVMERQVASDDQKSKLCDIIIASKCKVPHIIKKINMLRTIDPELYNYLTYLERVNIGIWCDTCNKQKNISDAVDSAYNYDDDSYRNIRSTITSDNLLL
jgi:hypothetical protein